MKVTIDFDEIEIETLQRLYTECNDNLDSKKSLSIYMDEDEDENSIKDLEDKLSVVEHICRAIEGIV
jgi:hypothetical protein